MSINKKSEHPEYLNKLLETTKTKRSREKIESIDFYTDGSDFKGKNKKGFGIYTCFNKEEYMFHGDGTPSGIVNFLKLPDYQMDIFKDVSNPTMELLAVAYLLHFLHEEHSAKRIESFIVNIYYDYTGVAHWISGTWKRKKPYIALIREFAVKHMKILEAAGFVINFIWIKGHSGNLGNDGADAAAKGTLMERTLPLKDMFI